MMPPSYVLVRVGVPDDALDLSAVDLAREPARTPAMDGGKAAVSVSLSPDQNARAPTMAEVSERRQPARGGAVSPTTCPRDPTTSPEPPRPEFFPPDPPLETLAPAPSRPYKKAPSTPQTTTPLEHNTPALLSSSLPRNRPNSASVRRRVPGDSGRRWSFCWCKV
jgi:hypothetical protein